MHKQPNGTPGKKPPPRSVKVSLHKLGIAEVDTAPYRSSPPHLVATNKSRISLPYQRGGEKRHCPMWLDFQPWLPLLTISLTITLCFLAGIALGLRYKVLILVPAVTLAMIFAMIIGVARADHFWSIVLAMVVLGTAVQFGYLAGIAIRAAVGSVIPLPLAQVAQRHAP